jgi:alkylated DNA repair dioxygenase AlkB
VPGGHRSTINGKYEVIEKTELRDGGWLLYDAAFFAPAEADELFTTLRAEIEWQQEVGRGRPWPRLTAWVADAGLAYRYSGVTHIGTGWTPTLIGVKQRIELAAAATFNSVLLNRYRSGKDSIGMHADDEPELGTNPVVASVSLGAVRTFILKHRESGEKRAMPLAHGSLLVMAGTCQHHWLHGVPKTEQAVSERVNLTFRLIYRPTGAPPTGAEDMGDGREPGGTAD